MGDAFGANHLWTGSSLVKALASHLFSAKSLPELKLTNCQLNPWEWNSVHLSFCLKKGIGKCLQNGGHFVHLWINSLWSNDALWWHRSWSTLFQVMAWCLTAPSHYLNQYWSMIIDGILWHSLASRFMRRVQDINLQNGFGNYTFDYCHISQGLMSFKLLAHLDRG